MPPIDTSLALLLFWAVTGYLAGSIPFGLILARVLNLGNLREIGSGSIGATNVLRTGSKRAAALTLLLDAGKGAVVVLAARYFAGEDAAQLAALAALIGHCYPVWLRFQGGKAVATFFGVIYALAWPLGIACSVAWLSGAAIWRISSMGALVAASASSCLAVLMGYGYMLVLLALLTVLIFWRHRANIARLRAGTEPRIGASNG